MHAYWHWVTTTKQRFIMLLIMAVTTAWSTVHHKNNLYEHFDRKRANRHHETRAECRTVYSRWLYTYSGRVGEMDLWGDGS